jgi:hypothetical protein
MTVSPSSIILLGTAKLIFKIILIFNFSHVAIVYKKVTNTNKKRPAAIFAPFSLKRSFPPDIRSVNIEVSFI